MRNFDQNDKHPFAGAFLKGFISGFTSPLTLFSAGPSVPGGFSASNRSSVAASFRSVGNALTHSTLRSVDDRDRTSGRR